MNWLLIIPESQLINSSLANRVLQIIFARSITISDRNAIIIHEPIPELNLAGSRYFSAATIWAKILYKAKISKLFNLEISAKHYKTISPVRKVFAFTSGVNLQIDILNLGLNWARNYFPNSMGHSCCPDVEYVNQFTESFNIAHIRLGDTLQSDTLRREDYHPLPVSFYKKIQKLSGKPFAFIFQDDSISWYRERLLEECKDSIALPLGCVHRDFWLLRNSKEVTIAISTFSFAAAWLSQKSEVIWIANAGFFNEKIRQDVNLLSSNDPRFRIIEVKSPVFNDSENSLLKYLLE
jgi:hypothetical protein